MSLTAVRIPLWNKESLGSNENCSWHLQPQPVLKAGPTVSQVKVVINKINLVTFFLFKIWVINSLGERTKAMSILAHFFLKLRM